MLNDDKTEFLLVGTRKQLTKVSIDGVRVGDYNVSPSPSVRNLGTWFDPHLDMDVHKLPKHAVVHFIIFIISDILGSTYPEVVPKH